MLPRIAVGALLVGVRTTTFIAHVQRISRRLCRRSSFTQLNSFRLIGGQYAGLLATFDALNGKHIPIDERYIPSSLLEWGYPPATLEILVAETASPILQGESGPKDGSQTASYTHHPSSSDWISLTRALSIIMPATGCDVDNLETIHTKEEWSSSRLFCHRHPEKGLDLVSAASTISVLERPVNATPTIRIESYFGWTLLDESKNQEQNAVSEADSNLYRTRITLNLGQALSPDDTDSLPNDWKLVSPIQVSLERQLSSSAETTTLASGDGGLDARSVANYLGRTLNGERMRNFPLDSSAANCAWAQHESRAINEHNNIAHDLFLAGNLTVSLRTIRTTNQEACGHSHRVDIGHITGRTDTGEDSPSIRHVISFHLPGPSSKTQTVEANHEDIINSCMVTSRIELGTILRK
jgi:hypothetical protein